MDAGDGRPVRAWLRHYRRYWRPFLSRQEKARIVAAIAEVEALTTGRICVHVVAYVRTPDILDYARQQFLRLGLDRTSARSGVLVLISRWDHRFAIWGDAGLHAAADGNLWARAGEALLVHFTAHRHAEGIVACVRAVGDTLARHFPNAEHASVQPVVNE